ARAFRHASQGRAYRNGDRRIEPLCRQTLGHDWSQRRAGRCCRQDLPGSRDVRQPHGVRRHASYRPGIWGEPNDPEECRRVLRRAVELGVDFIDTADSYGPEVSERLIAEALHPYPAGLVIATKGGQVRPGPGQWVPEGRPEHLRAALEGSL